MVPDEKLVKSPNFDFPSILFGVFSRQTAWSQYFASIVNKSQFWLLPNPISGISNSFSIEFQVSTVSTSTMELEKSGLLVDALPYIDHGYDEAGVREAVSIPSGFYTFWG